MKKQDKFFVTLFILCFLVCEAVLSKEYFYEKIEPLIGVEVSPEPAKEVEVLQETQPAKEQTEDVVTEVPKEPEPEAEPEEPLTEDGKFRTVGYEYFDDALFIGDSRMEGIMEYGGLDNADFFAHSGMSVFSLSEKKLMVHGKKMSFDEVLENKQYGKVYLMIGINELGYQFDQVEKKYAQRVETIKEKQPDAVIYLCANLHVTTEQSEKDAIYNNDNVNRLNAMIQGLADGHRTIYIDVHEIFDDDNGGLSKEYSVDSLHVLGKYYVTWVDWLCTKAI